MAQQEVRFFRSLKELESAIDQTVSNLPSIHEKGLFSDINSTENRKLFKRFNSLITKKENLDKDIQTLETNIVTKTDKISELIKNSSIDIEKKIQLEALYKQYSEIENNFFYDRKKVKRNVKTLIRNFNEEKDGVFKAEKQILDLLEKNKGCKQSLMDGEFFSDNILSYTEKNSIEATSNLKKIDKADQSLDTVLDQIKKQDCKLLSGTYTSKVLKKVEETKNIVNIVKRELTRSKTNQNNKSLDYTLLMLNDKIAKANSSIKEIAGLINQLKFCLHIEFKVNSLPGKLDSFLKNLKSGELGNDIVPENLNDDVKAYIRTLEKSSGILSLIKDSCYHISDDLDDYINMLSSSYKTYIRFLDSLNDTAIEFKDFVQTTGKLSLNKKAIINLEKNIKKIDSQLSKKLDKHRRKLTANREDKRNNEQQREDVLKKTKKWEKRHPNLLKTTIDSIKQTPGFERIREDKSVHSSIDDESCKKTVGDGIINVIIPQGNGRQMMLMTLDKRKNAQHLHIKVPLNDVINAQVSALPIRFDQILIADSDGKIYYLSSQHQLSEKKQFGRFQYNTFTYDYVGYQNVKEILKITTHSGQPKSVSVTPQTQYLDGLSRTNSIPVGDKDFRAFVQPINLPAKYCEPSSASDLGSSSSNIIEKQWYLIGVINEERFQKTALAAPSLTVGSAILLIIIALALLPFLNVVLADRHTLLTRHLRSLVVWSLGVVFSFSILLACFFVSSYLLNEENQHAVKKLNNDLKHQFNAELFEKLNAVELQQHIFSKNTIETSLKPCLKVYIKMASTMFSTKKMPLPFYTFLVLNDEGKHARLINSIKKQPIMKSASLKNRTYYKNALNDKMWKLEPKEPKDNKLSDSELELELEETCNIKNIPKISGFKEVYIQRIISYLDGAYETIISSVLDDQRVTVMDVRFDSFFRRILPLHNSFAVVENNTGRVLYHSTPKRALVENFIDETDGSTALISKLYHQKEGALTLTYQGKSIQAYVAPLLRNQDNNQVLWSLITYKVLGLDEDRLLVSVLTVAAFLLVISISIFIALEVLLSCLGRNSIAKLEKRIGCSQVDKYSATISKSLIRNSLLVLFLFIVVFSIGSYYFVLSSLENATINYASEYQHKASAYRSAGYQNIYKKLNWEILKGEGEEKKIQKADYVERMVSLYQTIETEAIVQDKIESLGLSLLDYVLPVISYSTGVFSENLIVEAEEKTVLYLTGVIDEKPVFRTWLAIFILAILILILIFIIFKLIKAAIDLLVINLFNEVNSNLWLIQDTTHTTSSKYKILLVFKQEQLVKYIKKTIDKRENGQLVIINTSDSLSLYDHTYPEGAVIFITDFASIVLEDENKKSLLTLLETLVAQEVEIIMASNIVPAYWLKMQEQNIDQHLPSDTGMSMELYRWSQLLERFEVIIEHSEKDKKIADSTPPTRDNFFKHWTLCSFEEQSVLSSLATNNLVNRHNAEAIDSLLVKDLIEQTPDLNFQKNLRIKDKAFVNFIDQHFHKSSANVWHKQGHDQLWSAILPVVLVFILLAVIFLVTTGTEALQYSLSVITALVAAIPTLSVVFGFFKNK